MKRLALLVVAAFAVAMPLQAQMSDVLARIGKPNPAGVYRFPAALHELAAGGAKLTAFSFGQNGSWIALNDQGNFKVFGVRAQALFDAFKDTTGLRYIAIGRDFDVVRTGGFLYWSGNTPLELATRIKDLGAANEPITDVAVGPDGQWTIVTTRQWFATNIPQDLSDLIVKTQRERHTMPVRFAFGPNGSALAVMSDHQVLYSRIPNDMLAKINEYIQQKRLIDVVALGPDGAWVVSCTDGSWYANVPNRNFLNRFLTKNPPDTATADGYAQALQERGLSQPQIGASVLAKGFDLLRKLYANQNSITAQDAFRDVQFGLVADKIAPELEPQIALMLSQAYYFVVKYSRLAGAQKSDCARYQVGLFRIAQWRPWLTKVPAGNEQLSAALTKAFGEELQAVEAIPHATCS